MKNMKKSITKTDILFCLCGGMLPIFGMLVILFSRHFYPFGDNTLFTMDMRSQYAEFFASLRYLSGTDNSIFCSFSRSLGGNYIGLFAYYLANPLSFLVNIFPLEKLYAGILVLTLLKIGLCGVTFSVFTLYLWKKSFSSSKEQFFLLPLSICYALMSYNMVYSQALMWLDGVIFLPLVILGVEKLLEREKVSGKKSLVLILSLAASFICNYYTGYMLALFATLFLLFRFVCKSSSDKGFSCISNSVKDFFAFVKSGLLAFGLAAPLLIPVALDLFSGKMTGVSVDYEGLTGFTFLEWIGKLTNGSYDSLTYATVPNIYCGFLPLLLVIAFFVLRKVDKKKKLAALGMLAVLYFSMYFNPLNVIWHGFRAPNSYPYRNAFLFSFFLLYLSAEAVLALYKAVSQGFAKMREADSDQPNISQPKILWGKALMLGSFLVFFLYCSLDMGINGRKLLYALENEYDYDTVTDYENYLVTTAPLVTDILDADTSFYRVNQLYEYSKNDAMLWGYHGIAHYSSTYNQAVNDLTGNLGMSADWLWNAGYGSTPLTDSLLGVKYVLARYELPENYICLKESGYGTAIYENKLALPLIYSAPLSRPDLHFDRTQPEYASNGFENQNALLQSIADTTDAYFSAVPYQESHQASKQNSLQNSAQNSLQNSAGNQEWIYRFQVPSADPVYLYIPSEEYTYTEVYVNDHFVGNYFSSESKCNLYLGTFEPKEEVVVRVVPSDMIATGTPLIYSLDMEALAIALESLNQNAISLTSHKSGCLEGTIHVDENETIVTSLPYDKGWTVKIDNKKVPVSCFADTFLVIPAPPGDHTISLTYVSPGFYAGLLVFGVAILLCLHTVYNRREHPLHLFRF